MFSDKILSRRLWPHRLLDLKPLEFYFDTLDVEVCSNGDHTRDTLDKHSGCVFIVTGRTSTSSEQRVLDVVSVSEPKETLSSAGIEMVSSNLILTAVGLYCSPVGASTLS